MQVEAGKYYRTREGKRAYIIGSLPVEIKDACRVMGVIFNESGLHTHEEWYTNGRYTPPGHQIHKDDIIGDWIPTTADSLAANIMVIIGSRSLFSDTELRRAITLVIQEFVGQSV